jgi:uncharacterized protein YbaR (Trm112 family)
MTLSELLTVLCCPETRQELRLAEPAEVARLNQAIASGTLTNRAGRSVKEQIDGGLVRADGKYLYPIRGHVPVLLVDESFPTGPG